MIVKTRSELANTPTLLYKSCLVQIRYDVVRSDSNISQKQAI